MRVRFDYDTQSFEILMENVVVVTVPKEMIEEAVPDQVSLEHRVKALEANEVRLAERVMGLEKDRLLRLKREDK